MSGVSTIDKLGPNVGEFTAPTPRPDKLPLDGRDELADGFLGGIGGPSSFARSSFISTFIGRGTRGGTGGGSSRLISLIRGVNLIKFDNDELCLRT